MLPVSYEVSKTFLLIVTLRSLLLLLVLGFQIQGVTEIGSVIGVYLMVLLRRIMFGIFPPMSSSSLCSIWGSELSWSTSSWLVIFGTLSSSGIEIGSRLFGSLSKRIFFFPKSIINHYQQIYDCSKALLENILLSSYWFFWMKALGWYYRVRQQSVQHTFLWLKPLYFFWSKVINLGFK